MNRIQMRLRSNFIYATTKNNPKMAIFSSENKEPNSNGTFVLIWFDYIRITYVPLSNLKFSGSDHTENNKMEPRARAIRFVRLVVMNSPGEFLSILLWTQLRWKWCTNNMDAQKGTLGTKSRESNYLDLFSRSLSWKCASAPSWNTTVPSEWIYLRICKQ